MRPVTLGSPHGQNDFYTWALGAFKQIEQASNDTLTDDASSSGSALATCAGAAANQLVYFTSDTATAFADFSPLAQTLLAETTAAAMLATLGAAPASSGYLVAANNLSDVASAPTSRTNLGLGTAATHAATDFMVGSNNLSEVVTPATARTNLGLGTAATHAATDFMVGSNNLSEVTTPATARSNIAAAGQTQTEFITNFIPTLAIATYNIIEKIPFGATITAFTAKLGAGTITLTLAINGTNITGGAINCTSGQQSVAPSALNVMSAGNTLSMTTSSDISASLLSFTVAYTRTLA